MLSGSLSPTFTAVCQPGNGGLEILIHANGDGPELGRILGLHTRLLMIPGSGSSTLSPLCNFTLAVFSSTVVVEGVVHGTSTTPLTRTPTTNH
jgi:hypothetical protein